MIEKIAYIILATVAGLWLLALLVGMIAAFPYGLLGLVVVSGFGLLFIKALVDRLTSEEDDYYSKNIDK